MRAYQFERGIWGMLQRAFAVIGLLTVMLGFQNCAETQFTSADNSIAAKSSLIPIVSNDGSGDAGGVLSQVSDMEPARGQDDRADDSDSDSSDDSDSYEGEDDSGLVACILEGPGKSVKLGLSDDSLNGVNAVSKSVCISVKACTEIVPKLFPVQGPEDRGYCAHNPNVIRLTDAEVQALVDAALKK